VDADRLELALAFLNSRDGSRDMLSSARRAQRWLAGETFTGVDSGFQRLLPAMHALAGAEPPGDAEVDAVRAIRDALLAWIEGVPFEAATLEQVSLKVDTGAESPALRPGGTGIRALAEHAFLVLLELSIAGESDRLHRCQSDDCRWVFFDRSRNRSKVWCDMSGCGSRAKARAYRARRSARRAT
jgi:hypothetical protein